MTTPTAPAFHIPYAEISRRIVAAHKERVSRGHGAVAARIRRTVREVARLPLAR
ncbi:MAG TPA: hypothetical protein VM616_09040 [Gammaproteobacteria bacterium]|nr:hypothetical protein [Gammaproteobacteria bacterium]